MNKQVPDSMLRFDVNFYGFQQNITPVISKCRVRIFYKGMNRNRTYITEDFAQQLVNSLSYVPIKGIFDKDDIDFQGHGYDNTCGRIYGVVPENPNFAWEQHVDEDGIMREYACADAYLFTGLYPEAKLIPNKSQSMEIYKKTFDGVWKEDENGEPYFMFEKGCLVGLQVLGDETEPCFEGAEFFELCKDIKALTSYMKQILEKEAEKDTMELENTVMTESTEEVALENEVVEETVVSTEDVATENSNEESVTVEETTEETVDFTKQIEELQAEIAANKEALKEYSAKIETLTSEKESLEAQLAESKVTIADYTKQIEELVATNQSLEAEKVEMTKQINDITIENEKLSGFKLQSEIDKKKEILAKYESYLNETIYKDLESKIGEFTVDQFKKEVCTAAVESSSILEKESELVYTGNSYAEKSYGSEIERILDRYKNGGM